VTRILILQKKCWVIVLTNRLDKIFQNLKAKNEKALITFSVSGYPDEETSLEICKAISDSGAHIHELNIPHEEAQADGPIIQLANIESINNGITLDKTINIASKLRTYNSELGICLMGYLNNIFIYGIEKFAKKINEAGVDAVICVDLPTDVKEEKELNSALKKYEIALIKLITPTTANQRIKEIVKDASGFLYSVNLKGITGVKTAQVTEANNQVKKIKKHTNLPVVAGFGIKTEEDVKSFSESDCSGIVIGSAIIQKVTESVKKNEDKHIVANVIRDYCKRIIKILN
jgi:tryptophan synthase alpha chain